MYATFALTLGAFLLFAAKVRFIEDIYAIIPKDEKTSKLAQVFQNSKFADKLTVMISLKDTARANPDSLAIYADSLAHRLSLSAPSYIKNIRYKGDEELASQLFQTVQAHLPVFLNEKDYEKIDSLIQPQKLARTLHTESKLLMAPMGFAFKDVILNDPSGISFIVLNKLKTLQVDENFTLHDNQYIITKDKKTILMFITPVYAAGNTGKNKVLIGHLDDAIGSLAASGFRQVDTQYFGGAVVSEGNASQLRKDTLLTQGITVLFLIVFISLYFRRKRAPLLILIPVVYGSAMALAAVWFIRGSISVIALGTGAIVLGIAVNYSLHVFNHFRHTGDMRKVVQDLATPLTIGSFTTIAGFFSLKFATSDVLRDLGLFAGFSLIGAALCSLIFLPHFAGRIEGHAEGESWLDKLATRKGERQKWLVLIILVLTVVFYFFAGKVGFEADMMSLNYMPAKLKKAEQKLNHISGAATKSVYLVTDGANLDDALAKNEAVQDEIDKLKSTHLIAASSGVSMLFISDDLQRQRIRQWEQYWTPDRKQRVLANIRKAGAEAGFSAEAFSNFEKLLNTRFVPVDKQALESVKKNYLDDYFSESKGQVSVTTLLKVPEQHKQKVISLLEREPGATVLDRQYLTARFTEMVSNDFNRIAWIVSLMVAIVLFLTFGRLELMLMAFIPMLFSWVWILGIMGIAGIKFNIVNIIVSTLIFGLGDDYSLFVMDGLINEYKTGKKNLDSFKSSILLSAVTTVVGLGVMAFAKHPALRSIAFISVTGILCVVIMAQVLIPFFFNMVISNRASKGLHPWTLWSWGRSVFAFFYFGLVSLLLTALGLVLVKLPVLGRERGKRVYHKLLSGFCWSVVYLMANVRKQKINPCGENFDKPAVVIANHQSFLDILMMAMLSPRLILLTNRWVWKSPVFGWAIRMADFYPVAQGVEKSVELLKARVDQGYSIAVFPEGTRSSEAPMKRFHKGAFYLAEKLNLDIVPVLLHGTGYTMSKGDYLLKNGQLTAQFLPRIESGDQSWGNNYQQRGKRISAYFKELYRQLAEELEQPRYFRERLVSNYMYKGPVLTGYLRVKVRLEKYYQLFHELLPVEGKILDLGCGYGFMVYMLYWASQKRRRITGVDYDKEKLETANRCFSKTSDLQFIYTDITQFEPEKSDGIVISDVLHYLVPDEQIRLIQKSIEALLPGGVLIIRDGDSDLVQKHQGTKLTEFISTRLLSFNKTANDLHFVSGTLIREIADQYGLSLEVIDQTRFTSNLIWVLRKPAEEKSWR